MATSDPRFPLAPTFDFGCLRLLLCPEQRQRRREGHLEHPAHELTYLSMAAVEGNVIIAF